MSFRLKSTTLAIITLALSLTVSFAPVLPLGILPTVAQSTQSRKDEAEQLNQQGTQQYRHGEYRKALESIQKALGIYKEIGDRSGEGNTLNNIGFIYDSLGQYSKALEFYQQALAIRKQIGDHSSLLETLRRTGNIYFRLNQISKWIELNQKALELSRKIGDRRSEVDALVDLGMSYHRSAAFGGSERSKLLSTSLNYYQHALEIYRKIEDKAAEDRVTEGRILYLTGGVYDSMGFPQQGLKLYQQALKIAREANDRLIEGSIFQGIAATQFDLKNYEQALTYLQQSLLISREIRYREGEAGALADLGSLLTSLNRPELAIAFYKQSIDIFEAIRQDLRTRPKEEQRLYTKLVAAPYRDLANILLKQDRILEAQQVLDLLKVQELDDYLRNVRGGSQPLYELPPEQAILKKYNELQTSAIQLGQELTKLRKLPEVNRTAAQQQRIAQLVKLQDDLNQQFNAFIERGDVVALVKQLTPAVLRQTVDLTQFDALRHDLRQLNAVMLYPLVLDDRLELVITTPDSPPLRRTVNVKREALNAAIVEFRRALQNPNSDAKVPAQKLYTWLIKPLEADLAQAKAKTIIYAPDGQLRYIPLQALYDGQQWLVQRYGINNITARSFTEFKTQPVRQPHVLAGAFATGQYSFQVGDRSLTFNGLLFAGREVDALATLVPNTKKLVDQFFSRDSTTTQMNEFNVVHLATHANFVPGIATDSFIVFGNGDKATLKDIESWSLNNVDLVVLSACETGLGGKFGNGEEILGLGYQFQNRGAKAAIASLWPVDDGGTEALMSAFYTALKSGSMTKAEALQKAQLSMINRKPQSGGTTTPRSSVNPPPGSGHTSSITRDPSHPYYWAPFILIGNGL